MKELAARGIQPLQRQPLEGEEGWFFDVQLDRVRYSLSVQWVPIGKVDFWAVELERRIGLVARAFSAARKTEVSTFARVVDEIARLIPEMRDRRWLTQSELREVV